MLISTWLLSNLTLPCFWTKVNAVVLDQDSSSTKLSMMNSLKKLLLLLKLPLQLVIQWMKILTKVHKSVDNNSTKFWDTSIVVSKKVLLWWWEERDTVRRVTLFNQPSLLMSKITWKLLKKKSSVQSCKSWNSVITMKSSKELTILNTDLLPVLLPRTLKLTRDWLMLSEPVPSMSTVMMYLTPTHHLEDSKILESEEN